MKKTTLNFLKKNKAWTSGVEYYKTLNTTSTVEVLKKCADDKEFDHAIWLIKRVLNRKELIKFAVFCAEQVIDIFVKEYPNDNRPRKAIEAAKEIIKRDTKLNRAAALTTARAAYAAYAAAAAVCADLIRKRIPFSVIESAWREK